MKHYQETKSQFSIKKETDLGDGRREVQVRVKLPVPCLEHPKGTLQFHTMTIPQHWTCGTCGKVLRVETERNRASISEA